LVADDPSSVDRTDPVSEATLTNVRAGRGGEVDHALDFKPTFKVGDVVADRYVVEQYLARGGMGEVYRVLDRELGESVALKTILPRSAEDPTSLERFRREIHIARQVSHRNVCRIFDLGRHEQDGGEVVVFLTMELLEGVSLRARLRESTMATDEALDVVDQLCAGLGAAHRKGIVHRDLKPSNIFLVPEEDTTRVVIADFGLARTEFKEEGQLTVTGTGEILGTPAYMSPEQIEGKPATTASDIYSLGLVMYETLTGAQPFEGESAFQIAINKLREQPTNPSTRVQGLPLLWDRTILRCLEREPEDRFASVEDIPKVLYGERRIPRKRLSRTLRRPAVWIPVAVVAAAVVVLALGVTTGRLGLFGADEGVEIRQSVAVLGFENNSPDEETDWIATVLGDFLTTDLAAGGALRAVPSQSVVRARDELGIDTVTTLAPETLQRLRELLAVDLVVLGSYTIQGGGEEAPLRLDYRVQNVDDPEPIVIAQTSGPRSDLGRIAAGAATEIRLRLGLDAVDAAVAAGLLPTDPEAARLYAEGVARLRSFDPRGAQLKLEQAAAAEPGSPVVWLELAEAWSEMGYAENAIEAARRAQELSGDLDREHRLRIEGQYQYLAGEYDDAVESFRSLWLVYPDNLEDGLRLVDAQISAEMFDDAMATLADLRALPEPLRDDPRIDLAESRTAGQIGDANRRAAAAERVVTASREIGSSTLEGEGRLALGNALRSLGELESSMTEIDAARTLFRVTGNRAGEASAAYAQAQIHLSAGRFDDAVAACKGCIDTAREVGARTSEGNALNLLGAIRLQQGDLASALDAFSDALELQREVGNRSGEADTLNNVALVQMWSGDFVAAVDSFNQVLVRYRAIGKPQKEAAVVMNLGRLDAVRGDLDGARRLFEEAAGLYRMQDNPEALAEALFGLGEVLVMQGDLEGARSRHEEALRIRRDHELGAAAESEFALAGVTLSEAAVGRRSYSDAVDELTRSVAALEMQQRPALQADALNYLAEAHLGAGQSAEAETDLARIREMTDTTANPVTLMVLAINEAKLDGSRGRHEAAEARLRTVMTEARQQSSFGVELEAQLALAQVLADAGRTAEAMRALDDVDRAATAKGWILVSDRASFLANQLTER
jgi:tetratricopeptide (TPR) repeat protein